MDMTIGELIELLKNIPEDAYISSIQLMDDDGQTHITTEEFEVEYDESAQQVHFLGHLSHVL
jgi:hypothetical protein